MYREKVSMCFVKGLKSRGLVCMTPLFTLSLPLVCGLHKLSEGLQISIYRSKEEQGQKEVTPQSSMDVRKLKWLIIVSEVIIQYNNWESIPEKIIMQLQIHMLFFVFAILVILLDWGYKANPPWQSLRGTRPSFHWLITNHQQSVCLNNVPDQTSLVQKHTHSHTFILIHTTTWLWKKKKRGRLQGVGIMIVDMIQVLFVCSS